MIYEEKIRSVQSLSDDTDDYEWYHPFRHHRRGHHMHGRRDMHRRHRRHGGCHCMRQPNGGNSGYCGQCSSDGTAFGCGDSGGCGRDCSKIKYSGRATDPCRDGGY